MPDDPHPLPEEIAGGDCLEGSATPTLAEDTELRPATLFSVLRRRSILVLAPVLALIALLAWAVASPVGSSPDDDFHLTSIWCASPNSAHYCQQDGVAGERVVPKSLAHPACYAFNAKKSASCQAGLTFVATPDTPSTRGNYAGGYPVVYYATMGLLAGNDIVASVIWMRVLNILLFVGLGTALYWLLPVRRRPALVWSWVITTVPLGLFVLASNNPSSWTITGVGMGWIALLGYFETAGRRRIALGALFALSALMAAGSRSDGAIYIVLAVIAVGILTFARSKTWMLTAIFPVVVASLCMVFFRSSRSFESLTTGLQDQNLPHDFLGLVVYNLLQGPSLWTGIFGDQWGLGWLDTSMPAIVWLGALACFVGVGIVAAGRMDWRKLTVLIGGAVGLWLLPTVILVAAGQAVGSNMQPRYLLPLIVLFAGVLLLGVQGQSIRLTRLQVFLVAATLSGAQFLALDFNIQRYVRGYDKLALNINSDIEWWWNTPISPMVVWLVGSAAFAALLFILLPRHSGVLPGERLREPASVAAAPER